VVLGAGAFSGVTADWQLVFNLSLLTPMRCWLLFRTPKRPDPSILPLRRRPARLDRTMEVSLHTRRPNAHSHLPSLPASFDLKTMSTLFFLSSRRKRNDTLILYAFSSSGCGLVPRIGPLSMPVKSTAPKTYDRAHPSRLSSTFSRTRHDDLPAPSILQEPLYYGQPRVSF